MKKLLSITSTLCCVAAFAASTVNAQQQLSFDELKAACQNPANYHNQVAPTNIQVSCLDVQTRWIPGNVGSTAADTSRQVTISVTSDKYSVAAMTETQASPPQIMSCASFKQIIEQVESVRAVTCDELIAYQGTAADFCAGAANDLRTANPTAIKTQETGQVLDLCGGAITSLQK